MKRVTASDFSLLLVRDGHWREPLRNHNAPGAFPISQLNAVPCQQIIMPENAANRPMPSGEEKPDSTSGSVIPKRGVLASIGYLLAGIILFQRSRPR